MRKRKILFGVTGIGYGHTFRQLPIIDYFAALSDVVIFAYDRSLEYFSRRFDRHSHVTVLRVAVPFIVGSPTGLDFEKTAGHPANKNVDFLGINSRVMAETEKMIGKPDLVISDYEPISAQYAYAHGSPLVTLDQQSKYLCADMPESLSGFTFADEIARLHLFFPRATARLAVSFFRVPKRKGGDFVRIFPPTIREEIIRLKPECRPEKETVLVYVSAARDFPQSIASVAAACGSAKGITFHAFLPETLHATAAPFASDRFIVHTHGDPMFYRILKKSSAIIATAGHSLLSEAMFLEIPVYAMPVAPYEQHMNAKIIADNHFGVSQKTVRPAVLRNFLGKRDYFRNAIHRDRTILNRGPGQEKIISFLKTVV